MSTGLPAAPKGGNELAERRVEIGRHGHQAQAVVDASIGQEHARAARAGDDDHVLALGCGQHRQPARELQQIVQAARADDAALLQHVVVDLVVAGKRAGVGARRPRALRRSAGLQHHHRLLLRDPLGDLGEGAPVLQVLQVHGDDLGVVVLLEEGEQIVLVDIGLVAQPDDGRHPHARRTAEADDRHADAARLRRKRRLALDVVRRAEGRAQILRRVVEAVDVRTHQARAVFARDLDDLVLTLDIRRPRRSPTG